MGAREVMVSQVAMEAVMDLKRRLGDSSVDFVSELTDHAGFTRQEAEDFLESAVPALVESYTWQAEALDAAGLSSTSGVRWLLAGVRAHTLARQTGLSPQRTWDALRALVPAVVRSVDAERGGAAARPPAALDVGFGLAVDGVPVVGRPRSYPDDGPGITHPIFGSLLRMQDLRHS